MKNHIIKKEENLIGSLKNKTKTVFIFLFFISSNLFAQNSNTISGTVVDDQNQPIPGATVLIKGTTTGVVSDEKGNFSLKTNKPLPVILVVSFTGLRTQEIDVYEMQPLQVSLSQSLNKLEEVVVSASQKSEALSKVPISLQTINSTELKSIPGGSFYDAISTLQGVNTLNTSIAFTVYNTRGFQSSTNLRFVQLVDGADNSSPELGIPIGNTIGPGESDVQRVELIPGASSAIYGLNSSNGLVNLITKDPFTLQGLSVSLKSGVNNINSPFKTSENIQASSYNNLSFRYAKALTDKIAFKVNLGYLKARDWVSGDVNDYQNFNGKSINNLTDPGYDGANVYGDEGGLSNNLILTGVPTHVSRTGYLEKDLTNYDSKLLHADASLVYKISDSTRISYTYRVGDMDGIFTRYNKLKFDDFVVQQHEVQLKSPNFSLRSYINTENSGNSYNLRFLADGLNTAASTNANWNANYTAGYNAAIAGGQSVNEAYQTARNAADTYRFQPGTARFDSTVNAIKQNPNWKTGAKFLAKGYFWHNEAIYDLSRFTKEVADLSVGADYRYTQVNSDGTFYADTAGGKRVYDVKFGGFIQAARNIGDYFRLVGSVRFDKEKYFDPKFTERVGLIFAPDKTNNFHLSYQNGYRFPTFYEAWTNVTVAAGRFVGGIQQNLQPSNILNNSYNYASVLQFTSVYKAALLQGNTSAQAFASSIGLLTVYNNDYLKPEQNQTIDFGYRGSFINNKIFFDLNIYGTKYNNFIQTFTVIKPTDGTSDNVQGATELLQNKITAFLTYSNVTSTVYAYGSSVGLGYNFYKGYDLSGNFNYNDFDWGTTPKNALTNGFNTPRFNVNISLSNNSVIKNFGFKLLYKWTDKTYWKSDFATGTVPSRSTVDLELKYHIQNTKGTFAVGGTNLLNRYYTQFIGGPSIGGLYYASFTFDGLLSK